MKARGGWVTACVMIACACNGSGTPAPSTTQSASAPTPQGSARSAPPAPSGSAPGGPLPPPGMVEVPAGPFAMGCEGQCNADERPVHEVRLAGFFIDRTEVTVAAYRRCSEAGACKSEGLTSQDDLGGHPADCNGLREDRDLHPINCVAWTDAEAFCAWAGKRLPTEAEWEKAARGTDRRTYPWGEADPDGSDDLVVFLNLGASSSARPYPNTTWPVGSKPRGASPHGALDMVGNVWEWTADWFDDTYYRRSTLVDPRGPERGQHRVIRGEVDGARMRVSRRSKLGPGTRLGVLGFRCARRVL